MADPKGGLREAVAMPAGARRNLAESYDAVRGRLTFHLLQVWQVGCGLGTLPS